MNMMYSFWSRAKCDKMSLEGHKLGT